ncbi:MAG TPA: serine/threonine-protein kinase, partial [Kofleriaceae bacterium]|nr:serine/threonine-protein kinase [Kofleriaceae bacterium]
MADPGSMLAGRYRAGRRLGQGGMGVVIEATHVELGTSVAIKLLRDDLAGQPETVERFLREARAAAQLKGEHVCRVHDFGTLDDGVPFMVMELLQGCDLATLVKQTGPLSHELVASYVVQACTAVAEAHAIGIVHRDLKPTNLFRTRRPDGSALIKILD